MEIITVSQLEALEEKILAIPGRWGGWTIDPDLATLELHLAFPDGRWHARQIDLEQLTTSAKVLDAIVQINGKNWATVDIVAGLVNAITDVLNPQATLCPFGRSKRLSAATIRRRCIDAGDRWPERTHPGPGEAE